MLTVEIPFRIIFASGGFVTVLAQRRAQSIINENDVRRHPAVGITG
jgi:hypothetical protein